MREFRPLSRGVAVTRLLLVSLQTSTKAECLLDATERMDENEEAVQLVVNAP